MAIKKKKAPIKKALKKTAKAKVKKVKKDVVLLKANGRAIEREPLEVRKLFFDLILDQTPEKYPKDSVYRTLPILFNDTYLLYPDGTLKKK